MITENLAIFLQDFGGPCSCGAYAFTGVLDAPDETLSMGGVNVLSTMYTLLVQSSDVTAGAIASGSAITATDKTGASRPFVVRDVLLQDDGAFCVLTLSK